MIEEFELEKASQETVNDAITLYQDYRILADKKGFVPLEFNVFFQAYCGLMELEKEYELQEYLNNG